MTMGPLGQQQSYDNFTTTTPRPEGNKPDKYTQFLFLLVSTILTLTGLICFARILFVYCSYKRRQQDERHRNTQASTAIVNTEHNPGLGIVPDGGMTNYGFADLPPRYDQLFKIDEPPPLYASVRSSQTITSQRQVTDTVFDENEASSLPQYEPNFASITAHHSTMDGSVITGSSTRSGTVLSDAQRATFSERDIEGISQRIQSHMQAVHERYCESVDSTSMGT